MKNILILILLSVVLFSCTSNSNYGVNPTNPTLTMQVSQILADTNNIDTIITCEKDDYVIMNGELRGKYTTYTTERNDDFGDIMLTLMLGIVCCVLVIKLAVNS